jgi:hypothetical protein
MVAPLLLHPHCEPQIIPETIYHKYGRMLDKYHILQPRRLRDVVEHKRVEV